MCIIDHDYACNYMFLNALVNCLFKVICVNHFLSRVFTGNKKGAEAPFYMMM